MALVVTVTVWLLFSCFLLFPLLGLPARLHRAAMTLLVAELVAAATWSYGSQDCVRRPCNAVAEAGRTAATLDLPLLSSALVLLAVVTGVRRHRRTAAR
jgi:chromate transport protein ChrA